MGCNKTNNYEKEGGGGGGGKKKIENFEQTYYLNDPYAFCSLTCRVTASLNEVSKKPKTNKTTCWLNEFALLDLGI